MRWVMFGFLGIGLFQGESYAPVDIRIAFGYKDTRPTRFVGDAYERLYLISNLIAPCRRPGDFACGFQRDPADGNRLEKVVLRSSAPQRLNIQVKITSAAAGPDDEDNRRNPYQKYLSEIAENNFLNGLREADAVFYIGHSRNGGGPNFAPPILGAKKQVAYNWYQKHRPGLKQMLKALSTKNNESLQLDLLACASTKHFKKTLLKASPGLRLATVPDLIYYSEALETTLKRVSKLIAERANDSDPRNLFPNSPAGGISRSNRDGTPGTHFVQGKKRSRTLSSQKPAGLRKHR